MSDNWHSVELKHLRALRAVAETGTFWAASEELSSSLSTVSDHITGLEALVGERLVERSRGRRTVTLTDAGRVLLSHAEAIEARLRAAEADFRAYAAGHAGSLRVGIYQSVANKVLPEVVRRFRARWPRVDVQVTESTYDNDLVSAVERGDTDLSFAIEPIASGPFEVRRLMSDPYVIVAAAGSPLARIRPRATDLAAVPMVAYRHGTRGDSAEEFLLGRGVRPRVVFRSTDNGTVQAMVASGLGFSLSPLLAVDETDPKVRVLPLEEPVPPRVLVIVAHRDRYRPPAATAFVETAVAVAGEIERAHDAFMAKVTRQRTRARGRRPRPPASRPA
ncbi:MAG TPA: LysR substrate-binding domain-containing protein [Candidatus Dormibacteraeota bacterium]|nr:LysR substrate-binding domain-containing protein [Candidatus Dormibacteraeota bacterium]